MSFSGHSITSITFPFVLVYIGWDAFWGNYLEWLNDEVIIHEWLNDGVIIQPFNKLLRETHIKRSIRHGLPNRKCWTYEFQRRRIARQQRTNGKIPLKYLWLKIKLIKVCHSICWWQKFAAWLNEWWGNSHPKMRLNQHGQKEKCEIQQNVH